MPQSPAALWWAVAALLVVLILLITFRLEAIRTEASVRVATGSQQGEHALDGEMGDRSISQGVAV